VSDQQIRLIRPCSRYFRRAACRRGGSFGTRFRASGRLAAFDGDFEILDTTDQQPDLKAKVEKFLNETKAQTKDLTTLISWGFRLVEYHKKPEYQAALEASPK